MSTAQPTGCTADDDFWELLPWYLNGSLDPAQHRRMAQHMELCETCQAEVTLQRELAATVMAADVVVPNSGEAYRAFADRIEHTGRRRGLAHHLRSAIDHYIIDKFRTDPPFAPTLLIAAAMLMVIGVGLMVQERPPLSIEGDYRTLTNSNRSDNDDVRHARVVFDPQISREEIQQAVAEIDARLVAGPSEQSVYVIAFVENAKSRDEVTAAIDALRNDSRVIFAERAFLMPEATALE